MNVNLWVLNNEIVACNKGCLIENENVTYTKGRDSVLCEYEIVNYKKRSEFVLCE